MKKKILLSAFACDPTFGSDEEVGWQWMRQLSSRNVDVTVITRASHRKSIEKYVEENGNYGNVKFVYVDLNKLHYFLSYFNRRNHIYYYFWQWTAYRKAIRLHDKNAFDLVHHVTWVSFRQPSFMGLLGIPMYFGPVAGGDEIPKGYTNYFSLKQKLIEIVRGFANVFVRFDPLMMMTFNHAKKVFFTSSSHLSKVSKDVQSKAQIELAIGCDLDSMELCEKTTTGEGNRLLFVGRCIAWKGMDIGLEIFSKIHETRPDVTLTIIGDGDDKRRWMMRAEELGVSKAITWLGWLPKENVLNLYSEYDVLFYPSLRDSGGFVVLEALQYGLPVVCFKLGGPGVVVDDTCGAAIDATSNINQTIQCYADKVISTLERVKADPALSLACNNRVRKFGWDALISRIYK